MTATFTGFKSTDLKATGKTTAEKFAATFWPDWPREIECWVGNTFRLRDGNSLYEPRMTKDAVEIWRIIEAVYQPKTGAKCGCKLGVMRDNCPACEGTGFVIDFRTIRNRCAREEINE